MDTDKLKQKLSQQQYIHVLEFIAHGNFNLEKLQLLETDSNQKIKQLQTDLTDSERYLSGIPFSIIGKIRRIDPKLRTTNQQSLLDKYSHEELEQLFDDFRVVQHELIASEQEHLALIKTIRQIFEEYYPEATTSPRLSRQELECSPSRFMAKSLSSPRLIPKNDKVPPILDSSPSRFFKKSLSHT
jgi:hypothetical protein